MRHPRAPWFLERIHNPLGGIFFSSISVMFPWLQPCWIGQRYISGSLCRVVYRKSYLQGRRCMRIPISSSPIVLCFCNPQFLTLSKSWSVQYLQAQGDALYARRSSKAGVKLRPKNPKLWPLLPSSRPAHPCCKSHSGHMQKRFKKL